MFEVTNKARQNRIRKLADAFKALDEGGRLTHQQIAKIVGITPCPTDILYSAMAMANQEAGTYLENQRGIGYIRRPDEEWDGVAVGVRRKIRRTSTKGRKTVVNIVKYSNRLSDDEQRRASREIGLMQTIEALTRRTASVP